MDSETIGDVFKRLRNGRSQATIADAAKVSQTGLSDYEHNKCRPSADVARRILDALGATPEDKALVAGLLKAGPLDELRAIDVITDAA